MAQSGDTITYTYSDGTSVAEDISSIDEITIEYIDGQGGNSAIENGNGGRVDNVVATVSDFDTLYLWVAGEGKGRYGDGSTVGGGSTEVSLLNTDINDSETEPFIAGAGGGGGVTEIFRGAPYDGGARGGSPEYGGQAGAGQAPPAGGDGYGDGDGAVDGHSGTQATIVNSGSTTVGGGSTGTSAGEIQISYVSTLSPPDPPSNLNAEVQ